MIAATLSFTKLIIRKTKIKAGTILLHLRVVLYILTTITGSMQLVHQILYIPRTKQKQGVTYGASVCVWILTSRWIYKYILYNFTMDCNYNTHLQYHHHYYYCI